MAAEDRAAHGFDVANLDRTCKPCDDFHQFAVGGWLKSNPIPAQYPVWGSFITLADKNQEALRGILESAAAKSSATAGSNEQKIGDFYASCMDTKEIDAQGLKPIGAELAAIESVRDTGGLLDTGARLQTQGVGVLFTFGSDQDFKDSSKVIGEANQGGLTLPDRDYYTRHIAAQLRQQQRSTGVGAGGGHERVRFAGECKANPTVCHVGSEQGAEVRIVLVACNREGDVIGDELARLYATLSSGPFHVGSPSGKWSRLATSTRCMPLITKKLRNMNASARLTWSNARLRMLRHV